MRSFLLFTVVCFVVGCGRQEPSELKTVFIDPELQVELDWWRAEFEAAGIPHLSYGPTISVRFAPAREMENGKYSGMCFKSKDGEPRYNKIVISAVHRNGGEALRKVVGHELGHCWYGLEHQPAGNLMSADYPEGLLNDLKPGFIEYIKASLDNYEIIKGSKS